MRRIPWGFLVLAVLAAVPASAADLATRLDQQDRFVADHEDLRAELARTLDLAGTDADAAIRAYRLIAERAADRAEAQIAEGFYGFQCRHLLDLAARALHDHRELLLTEGDRRYRAELVRLRAGLEDPAAPVAADPELGGTLLRLEETRDDPLLARIEELRERTTHLVDPPYSPEPDLALTARALAGQPARIDALAGLASALPGMEEEFRPLRARRGLETRFAALADLEEEARGHLEGTDTETARLALASLETEMKALAVEVDRVRRRFGDHPTLDRLDRQLEGLRTATLTQRETVFQASRRDPD